MASSTKSKSSAAFQHLADTLGTKPPKALDELPARDIQHLNDKIEQALLVHQETVAAAEQSIINQAPRPLRKPVAKILGA